jgi:Tfp pilus assembly protein PilO
MQKQLLKHLSYRYWLINRQQFVWSLGFILVAVILVFAVVVPQFSTVRELYSTLQKHTTTADKLQKKAEELEKFATSALAAKSGKITDTLPSKKPLLEILTGLSVAAGQTGVKFEDIALNPGKISTESAKPNAPKAPVAAKAKPGVASGKNYDQMELELTISGSLFQVNDFVKKVETLAPLATVTKLSLAPLSGKKVSEEETAARFEADLSISTYFFSQSVKTTLESALPVIGQKEQQTLAELDSFFFPDVSQPQTIQGGGVQDLFNADSLQFIDPAVLENI